MKTCLILIIAIFIFSPVAFSQSVGGLQVTVEADYSRFDSVKSVIYLKPVLTILGPQEKYYLHFYLIGQNTKKEKFVLLNLPVKQQKFSWQMKIEDNWEGDYLCYGWHIVNKNRKNVSDPLGAALIKKNKE